ncbi:glucose-1-phosphate adenylyltransferase [Streptomyces avermitilis]|uniref:Glucose-1-phosphate adenylyltransferase n=1 Tax=Streptomyces avermitilis (strain ATCC 31267 / DSM 46492 / JCM 5070 / NBRC 14893 / NCIMB 12804 / NRRL 8165 / MA-4680) TaxID=227882 RepID=GLGC_STRAW|nr:MULTISPECIES: glucose-1-phosphate adenylyltransferase [Streptomyces]Q826D9.1 RecName: Full=Glucose-1-phosphate adenylyltransferase; AltName: Full=ADP-glucose pyrophosphorylase; Short=ADPGlc PPase; AltName: Full=ADP-glucose synthase [Streptomyces avermitilis MA-4680 = NBRC 14893]KUN53411.1 glucose-1-phosphate adenylyltransferase [Streptomyces avermitilis]MYT02795.1 glucose-1-phosphate adenylyltransferase [Streptomyces sp. SID5469]OOV16098.1 glucose-1-phosphate adenylyltransferase [Streptomyce
MRRGGPSVLGIVLAGGEGKRLMPLTADRAKPAVTFGGTYRLVDFVLSNLVNADILRICVLTQYKSHSLDRHITTTWRMSSLLGNYITPVPAQQRLGPRWYLGSADAILQSLNLVYDERPEYIAVFGADHVYRMDPRQMLGEHIESGAGVTVAGIRVPRAESSSFGVIAPGSDGQTVENFLEKPADPPGLPGDPECVFASMGNYVFTTKVLIEALQRDAEDGDSVHDMGGSILPALTDRGEARLYDFSANHVPGETTRDQGYWRDVGTLDAYYDAHMDLIAERPAFNLFNRSWPIYTHSGQLSPARFNAGGIASESIISAGCLIRGQVTRSVLSPGVVVDPGAVVQGSVLHDNVHVGRGAVVRGAVLDKNVEVPPGATIGVNPGRDADLYTVSKGGVIGLGKGQRVS